MTARTYSILAGLVSSAVGAWWWNRSRAARRANLVPAREHGTVIYDNTPMASSTEGVI